MASCCPRFECDPTRLVSCSDCPAEEATESFHRAVSAAHQCSTGLLQPKEVGEGATSKGGSALLCERIHGAANGEMSDAEIVRSPFSAHPPAEAPLFLCSLFLLLFLPLFRAANGTEMILSLSVLYCCVPPFCPSSLSPSLPPSLASNGPLGLSLVDRAKNFLSSLPQANPSPGPVRRGAPTHGTLIACRRADEHAIDCGEKLQFRWRSNGFLQQRDKKKNTSATRENPSHHSRNGGRRKSGDLKAATRRQGKVGRLIAAHFARCMADSMQRARKVRELP